MVNENKWKEIRTECTKKGAHLVAVSKKRSNEDLKELYHLGQRSFGENRVQELLDKKDLLPSDIEWHLIGHLQRNKVKYIAQFITLIHSVDSIRLLKEINKQAKKNDRRIDCLLQFHIAEEESKFGITAANMESFMQEYLELDCSGIRLRGVMGMASFVDDSKQVADEFTSLKNIYKTLKNNYFSGDKSFDTLSMGMSGDYQLALENGSNMLRVGSKLFT